MEGTAEMSLWQYLHHIDKDITLFVNSISCPASDRIWAFFSTQQVWYLMYLVIAILFLRNLGWKKALVWVVAIVLCIVVSDQSSNIIKHAVQRLRPCHDLDMVASGLNVLESPGGLYGFFSSHASNSLSFAILSVMAFRCDKYRNYKTYNVCIIVWAVLVGLSRVFVGKHFVGDVLVGFAVGIVCALVFGTIARKICLRPSFSAPSWPVR